MVLPRLYAILDSGCFPTIDALCSAAEELTAAGCTLIQYRNKSGNARVMLEQAREVRRHSRLDSSSSLRLKNGYVRDDAREKLASQMQAETLPVRLMMNDRADVCLAADFDGVHVGQDDLSPEAVRRIIGADRWLGVSTHNPEQVKGADLTPADYIAIGPVFATASKEKPDPVVGLEGVRRARELTRKPLVAIGGVTRGNAASVIEAGADSVAVISDLLRDPRKSAEEFLRILR